MRSCGRKCAFALVLALAGSCFAAAEQTTLDKVFVEPPARSGINVWWHWQGPNVTKAGITRDLEAMKSAGVSGATIFTIQEVGWYAESRLKTPVNPALSFGNEAWWDMVRFAVSESRRLGLDLGIHNCAGYSCSGGDWIKPENAMKKLVWAKGDAQPETRLGFYRDIAKVETTNGVYRFGYTCTGKCCHPPPPGQEETCLEADKMSRRAVALHLDNVLGGFAAHGITASSPGLKFVLMDSYEAGWDGNWTDDMVEEFKRRRGYDPVPFLPVLAGMSTKFGEGLDIPEVSLVAILDADKEGFLRSETSLVQTVGRAARNVDGRVIMYADEVTDSMKKAIDETNRRRTIQIAYNEAHHITPTPIKKAINSSALSSLYKDEEAEKQKLENAIREGWKHADWQTMNVKDLRKAIEQKRRQMLAAAKALDFDSAAHLRDEMLQMEDRLDAIS